MPVREAADRQLLDHLRREGRASVGELGGVLGVTATAIRQRLRRLMADGLIEREEPGGEPAEKASLSAKQG
ncbi:MAG: Lrp/AsnC family transcriptional regulator, partial [Planctomycetota bacterium]